MTKRILSIALIWLCASAAWGTFGATLLVRTNASDDALRSSVGATWGTEQRQGAASMVASIAGTIRNARTNRYEPTITRVPLQLTRTRADVRIDLAPRQKGLLWYSTYDVVFKADYVFHNDGPARRVTASVPFPAERASYDDVRFFVGGRQVANANAGTALSGAADVAANADIRLHVEYHSRGLGSWTYDFGDRVTSVRDFQLRMHTNFAAIDFPANTNSPNSEVRTADGWLLTWSFRELISGYSIGMTMPERMQPGPLAQRLTFWAPVSLLFFFLVMFVITTLRRIDLHPMNYFFLAGAFFAFHLLFAYSVDLLALPLAFVICSVVSVFLVVSYLRLVVGLRFAALEAGGAQAIYLVLFSFALFYEGWSGLTITIGAIVTLYVMMQLTGRVRWSEIFRPVPEPS